MMASPGSEYNYSCQKCPRTFKLHEFYEKHQKVHMLKKQHVCSICGFVYGAAKGLEGHMESAHSSENSEPTPQDNRMPATLNSNHINHPPPVRNTLSRPLGVTQDSISPVDLSPQIPEMPFFHFLQAQGVLNSTDLIKQAQQAMLAQMTNNARSGLNGLSLVPISIAAPSSPNSGTNSPHKQQPNDKSKIPSPAGTGNYKIYDEVPEIQDASDAQQNDSGFFRCTICTREFSGLNSLKKHVPIHTRRVQHKCDTCGYVFGKKEYLLDHMRKHTGEISPVCEVCGQTFNKSLKLKEHLKLHRNTCNENGGVNEYAPWRCHICKQCFPRACALGEHLRAAHSETVYKCDMCDATFGDVRGKNHHMYNEHQLDAFHQKCVWCPVCNQGFTRHYNLKVHMYKSHGKEYLENNFSQEELDSLMRPPPGSNTSKPSPPARQRSDDETIRGSPTGVLPISPPLTPKLSPKLMKNGNSNDGSPTMVPSSSVIPSTSILKANLQRSSRPGPASLTKPQHYFDQEAQHAMLKCQLCDDKFLRKSDLFIHLNQQHGLRVLDCPQQCEDKFLKQEELEKHMSSVHGQSGATIRRPGPASRTNAPKEIRAVSSNNLPSHLAGQCGDQGPGFPCEQCGKVLMHKQSYVSHMRVIHGDYYGGNRWEGSSVVEMVLGGQQGGKRSAPSPINNNRNPEAREHNYNDYKFGLACEFCNKAFTDQTLLDEHIQSKHPNLTKRIQAFKAALGLKDSDEPDTKRFKLDYKEVHKRETDELTNNNNNNISSNNNNIIKPEKDEILLKEKYMLPSVVEETNQEFFLDSKQEDSQESKVEEVWEEEENDEYFQVKDRDDDTRYEPIEKDFAFNGESIQPSYCVLPFVTDEEVEKMTGRNIAEYYEQPEEYSEDEEGQMVIDENPPSNPSQLSPEQKRSPTPPPPNNNVIQRFNNNELKINSFGQGFADAINICKRESIPLLLQHQPEPTHSVKLEQHQQNLLYQTFPDFSLPFSLSGLIQKKKAEMAAILAPRLVSPKHDHPKMTLEHLAKATLAAKQSPISPTKSDSGNSSNSGGSNNTAVSEYENQIQNDLWPIDCIKCTTVLTNLDNFNIHMNDHWSDDKCCPVCGLLINSKRFNFKQHLKIHTGEKPFVCQVCSRAFRQKAHMVKHVTTHRTEPRGNGVGEVMGLGPYQSENSLLTMQLPGLKLETNGVIVQ